MLRSIDRRLVLAALITLTVAITFWMGSRIPNLNEKALMGGDAEIELLGFDVVFAIEPDDSFIERVVYTTVNWMDTNKRGMTFGVVLAACLMTLLTLFERKRLKNGFANALMGTVVGAPLGVCVNCAAPIAKGLHAAGARLEMTLAAMISSPTLNVIVLTMLFALFPWYMVATKLALTVAVILVVVPIAVRLLFKHDELIKAAQTSLPGEEGAVCEIPIGGPGAETSHPGTRWTTASMWVARTFAKHLWYIVRTTVPLMILAGFLGSLAIVALPWDTMTEMLPDDKSGKLLVMATMAGIAVIGTFLPVPIAFDVIVVAVLLAAGMPVKYAMVLLFTLGIFSIYSFQIIWKYISKRVAVALYTVIVVLGMGAGVGGHYISVWDENRQRQAMYDVLLNTDEAPVRPTITVPAGRDDGPLVADLQAAARVGEAVPVAQAGITVERIAFEPRTGAPAQRMFERLDGAALGIDEPSPFSLLRQISPRYWGRGIATGDVHNDGWPDVVMAADNLSVKGLSLYANRQGKGFVKQKISLPLLRDLEVVTVALVDLDNDGWLDIFVSAIRGGNHILYNRDGRFPAESAVSLPDTGAVVAAGVAFGDVDGDGDLDIVLGNWTIGSLHRSDPGQPAQSRNALLIQEDDGTFTKRDLEHYPGETLATMLTDINGDGALDLVVANDFNEPDVFYFGDGQGNFREIDKESGIVPHSTTSSMSIANADIDNDLVPELYIAQIAKGEGAGFAKKMADAVKGCEDLAETAARERCIETMTLNVAVDRSRSKRDTSLCMAIEEPVYREDCMALHVLWTARREKERRLCAMIPARRQDIKAVCNDIFSPHVPYDAATLRRAVPQVEMYNVLLDPAEDGKFVDRAVDLGIAVTGWSWNAKFADLDNDEWQDLYVANGMYPRAEQESNFFFRNQGGGTFVDRTEDSGLEDFRATGAYSYVDFDGDGDLDIISLPVQGAVRVFRNAAAGGNSLMVALRDERGNRFGIGSKVIVRYADGIRAQIREIQAGGGFISFDAPVAH
ncbi:MAG: hypothetical protein D6826_00995, partial [Alphaproteobacteria bacterium]